VARRRLRSPERSSAPRDLTCLPAPGLPLRTQGLRRPVPPRALERDREGVGRGSGLRRGPRAPARPRLAREAARGPRPTSERAARERASRVRAVARSQLGPLGGAAVARGAVQ
jgi:hypothetical protein